MYLYTRILYHTMYLKESKLKHRGFTLGVLMHYAAAASVVSAGVSSTSVDSTGATTSSSVVTFVSSICFNLFRAAKTDEVSIH